MKNEKADIIALLKRTQLFGVLTQTELEKLTEQYCVQKIYRRGETVLSKDTREKCIGIIISGEAAVKKEKILINKLRAGDIFGAVTLYNSSDSFVNTIVAQSDCTVVLIEKNGIEYLLETNSDFSKKYIEYLSDRIYFLNSKIKAYTIPDAEDKLLNYLNGISKDGEATLSIKMTELAKLLNLSRASLYRVFSELESTGKIIKNGKNIIII